MPKTLNERQAWLYLARKWAKPKLDPDLGPDQHPYITITQGQEARLIGLCGSVYALWQRGYLELDTRNAMEARLAAFAKGHTNISFCYFYPLTLEGAKQRAKLCRKLAKSCTE